MKIKMIIKDNMRKVKGTKIIIKMRVNIKLE